MGAAKRLKGICGSMPLCRAPEEFNGIRLYDPLFNRRFEFYCGLADIDKPGSPRMTGEEILGLLYASLILDKEGENYGSL
jgi:hypothetical protein